MKRFFLSIVLLMSALVVFSQAKYIFYFIGDGMGCNDIMLAEMYKAEMEGRIGRVPLTMSSFPFVGQATTYSASNSITDSSAAGTALATGSKTTNGTLGLDPEGKQLESVAEFLKKKDWRVGVTSSVSIDHATPGAFYGKSPKRSDYYLIGTQLAASQFDFFAGASFLQPVGKSGSADKNLYLLCEEAGYHFAHGVGEFSKMAAESEKLILIPGNEGLDITKKSHGQIPYVLDRRTKHELTLTDITLSAISFLSKEGAPFFLMVEGGAIDWANHSNDAATMLAEMLEFDDCIAKAFEFYQKHPDETLIVVTADHETGGLALGNSDYTLNLKLLRHQKMSLGKLSETLKQMHSKQGKKLKWDDVKTLFTENLGLYEGVEITPEEDAMLRNAFKKMMKGKADDVKTLYANTDALADMAVALLNKKAKVGWTTHSHSASAVPVLAIGAGADMFTGWMDNTEIKSKLLKAAGY